MIDPRYLTTADDVEDYRNGVRLAIEIIEQEAGVRAANDERRVERVARAARVDEHERAVGQRVGRVVPGV